jgi:ribosomal protein L11 methyltransferase
MTRGGADQCGGMVIVVDEAGNYYRIPRRLVEQARVPDEGQVAARQALNEGLTVQRLGARTVIRPPWRDYAPRSGEVVIDLDPGAAFGNGLHASTQLCLVALEERVAPGVRALDVGTGSGVLAIAAAKYGAASVDALDLEPAAAATARENVARNELLDRVRVAVGTVARTAEFAGRYDLVVANILAPVIIQLAPALAAALAPGGRLLASGITADGAAAVHESLVAAGLGTIAHRRSGAWTLIEGLRAGEAAALPALQ